MTALVAALGFVPMALATGTGAEVQKPLATVIVFGMACDTLLTMLALPVLYLLFGKGPEQGGDAVRTFDLAESNEERAVPAIG
jgi:cobalt-zinc-cadmium resistance protein CzcA